jgi:hypothetical protein
MNLQDKTIEQLKAMAYDCIARRENEEMMLREINQEIQKKMAEAPKEGKNVK